MGGMFRKSAEILVCILFFIGTEADEDGGKFCRLREAIYPLTIWNYVAGFYCYNYTNDYRLKFKYNYTSGICDQCNNSKVPVTMIDKTTFFTYNYHDSFSTEYIMKSFKTESFFKMWLDCAREAENCCDNVMTNDNIVPTDEYACPVIWDAWSCFPAAKNGTVQTLPCSKQAYSTDSAVCELQSRKECFRNGTWNQQTDYLFCAMAPVLRNRHFFNVVVLAVSAVVAFPAVVIFFSLRSLRRKVAFILHRNLILVIVIRDLLSIMSKEIIILDALNTHPKGVMARNSVACRVLAFFENAAKNGMYACMLADGFYLHKLIVRVFADEPRLSYIYIIVFGLSFGPSLIWAIVRDQHGAVDCWMVDDTEDQWIIDGFRIAILAVNFLFLFDIIRVMIMKLKQEKLSEHTRSTLRSTLFLIPLFGVYIFVITDRNMVPGHTCSAEDIYYYISYLIEGLQGVMVAILFCYLNSEVQKELKNAYRKFALMLESRFDIQLHKKPNFRRRTTAATFVGPFEHRPQSTFA